MTEKFRQATYKEIGHVLGISRQAVGYKMQGRGEFTLTELAILYEEYGISMWELQTEIECASRKYKRRKEKGLWQRNK